MALQTIRLVTVALLLSGCSIVQRKPAEPVNTAEIPTAPDDAADSLLIDLQRLDTTFLVDMRYATANNFTGAPLPGYEANRAYLRPEVAAALAVVNADLKLSGFGLKVFDAYRPVRASDAMLAWATRTNRIDLLRDGYIAARSRHNLGVAVDVTLYVLANKTEVTMGTPYDYFGRAAHTSSARGQIARNREILVKTMERQGFVNYDKEWWHFSYAVENPVRFDRVIR